MKKTLRNTLVILAAMMMPMTMLAGCGNAKNATETAPAPAGAYKDASVKSGAPSGENASAAKIEAASAEKAEAEAAPAKKADAEKKAIRAADAPKLAAAEAAGAESFAGDAVFNSDGMTDKMDDAMRLRPDVEPDIPPAQQQIQNNAEAFVLTAGEWNDNKNWGFFTNLVNKNLVAFPAFGLNPANRISASVKIGGKPARNITVELLFFDKVIWTAQTDKDGNAYLFYDAANYSGTLTVRALDQTAEVNGSGKKDEQSETTVSADTSVTLDIPEGDAPAYDKTEVMFILDTTGSMGDEILYLQKDFSVIAQETSGENVSFSMNFYRDKGDDYVTKCNPFTVDVKELQAQLNDEYARGGGDNPEAVAEILEETITKGSWSKDANKIAFLIFDAPPHSDNKSVQKVQTAIASAAEQGIHLVPVVASNSDRETELFGRAAAAMTNSNYVFLTDDSGVGGSHLEPIIGNYDVEKLHDIIVRNIKELAD